MKRSFVNTAESLPVNTVEVRRPTPAKAELRNQSESTAVNGSQSELRAVVSDVIRTVSSQKAAALEMGIDAGQLTRQLQSGHVTVERLEALGPQFAAEFGRRLVEQYGPLSSPADRIREDIREARRRLDAIEQGIEFLEK